MVGNSINWILPILFYSIYEVSRLSNDEKIIDDIYDKQMGLVLHSINQYTFDITDKWIQKLELINNSNNRAALFNEFLNSQSLAINSICIFDGSFNILESYPNENSVINSSSSKTKFFDFIETQKSIATKLLHRKKVGYTKIEPVLFSDNSTEYLILLFVSENKNQSNELISIEVNLDRFINYNLLSILADVGKEEFNIGVLKEGEETPMISVGNFDGRPVKMRKRIWILPNYQLGIQVRGASAEDIISDRFDRSLIVLTLISSILLLAIFILSKAIKREISLTNMKSDFVSNVSHELRTPLSLIRMFAETIELKRTTSEDEIIEYCKIIGYETKRLTLLINRILDFSKIQSNKKEYNFGSVDLNVELKRILAFYKFHLKNKGFTLETNFSDSPLFVNADKDAIDELVVNLLDNSIKYSDNRKEITVNTGEKNSKYYFEVCDKGVGIPKEFQNNIFEKFFRISSTLTQTTSFKGSGLGLTIIKHIMEAHNGNILVESAPNKGSKFMLLFPINKA